MIRKRYILTNSLNFMNQQFYLMCSRSKSL